APAHASVGVGRTPPPPAWIARGLAYKHSAPVARCGLAVEQPAAPARRHADDMARPARETSDGGEDRVGGAGLGPPRGDAALAGPARPQTPRPAVAAAP